MPARLIGPRLQGGGFYKKRPATKKPRVTKGVAKLAKPVQRAVKKIIMGQEETKFITNHFAQSVAHNSSITSGDYYRVLPHVTQGTGELNRIGDKIRPVSVTVKGQVAINREMIDENRAIMVRVLVLQLKTAHSYPQSSASWPSNYNNLLKLNDEGGTENIPFTGNGGDQYLPVNREMFDVLGERFIKLTQLKGVAATGEAAPVNAIAKNFNIKLKKVPRVLQYIAANQTEPTNYAPFMVFGYSYMDGTAPDTLARTGIVTDAQCHMYFKDA